MPVTLVVDNDRAFMDQCESLALLEDAPGQHRYIFAGTDEKAMCLLTEIDDLGVAIVAVDDESLSGLELFRSLAKGKARIPRIALTGADNLAIIRRAMNDGAADFLTRPVSMADLRQTVERVYAECERRRKAWRNQAQLSAIRREVDIASDIQKRILLVDFPEIKDLDDPSCAPHNEHR